MSALADAFKIVSADRILDLQRRHQFGDRLLILEPALLPL